MEIFSLFFKAPAFHLVNIEYLKVKYGSNEVSLRVEHPPVIHILLGLEKILRSAEFWVTPFETLEYTWQLSPLGEQCLRDQVLSPFCYLSCWPIWPHRRRRTHPEDFSRWNLSQVQDLLSHHSLLIPFRGSTGSCWSKPLVALLWCFAGEREECWWEGHLSTHLVWMLWDIIQMSLTHPSVLSICKGGSRVQAKQTFKVLLNRLLSSDRGLCTQLLRMALVCSQLCKSGWEV